MGAKEIRSLQEAYEAVYENQQLDEGKSSRPRYPGGRGVLDQERRDEKREASAENMRGHTAGPGTVTKNPKKLRKQKAMGEIEEGVDLFDIILEHLVAEGYADTNKAALAIMANMSEEWKQSIVEQDLTARQKYLMKKVGDMNAQKSGSAHTAIPGKQSAGGALDNANRSAMQMRGV